MKFRFLQWGNQLYTAILIISIKYDLKIFDYNSDLMLIRENNNDKMKKFISRHYDDFNINVLDNKILLLFIKVDSVCKLMRKKKGICNYFS
jgi:hypothetical protein